MNLEDLFVPARLAGLMAESLAAKASKMADNESNSLLVSERVLVELFLAAGALPPSRIEKMNPLLHLNESIQSLSSKSIDNQNNNTEMVKAMVEYVLAGEGNRIRYLMQRKRIALSELAKRYGGKSAASNLANFLAKPDDEIVKMRAATLLRLAASLECPVEWLHKPIPKA